MEWLALLTWTLLVPTAFVLGRWVLATPGAAIAAPVPLLGFALCLLFIVLDGPLWIGWVLVAVALAGVLADWIAVAWLVDDRRTVSVAGQVHEELQAGVVGLQLPLLIVLVLMSILMGLDLVTVA